MISATEAHLSTVNWQYFGTLTWRESKLGSISSRERELFDFLKWFTAFKSCDSFSRIPWVVRWERGEQGGRPHAHFLLAGCLPHLVTISSCFVGLTEWNNRCGMARIRLVRSSQAVKSTGMKSDCVSYVLKHGATVGADRYEARKFNQADRVILSPGLALHIAELTAA